MSSYYDELVAAFIRGRLPGERLPATVEELLALGQAHGLPLHYFKRVRLLPRIQWALGVLRTLQPANVLDIGSGRGKFLWPLLDAFPHLPVAAVDVDAKRVRDLEAVSRGGVERLAARQADAAGLPFAGGSFDIVTLLEVLEHTDTPHLALAEAARVVQRHLLLSVPSKPDDNPEHLHLFTEARLRTLLTQAGMRQVKIQQAPGHLLALAGH